jgi:hypothetical protein
MKDASNVTPGTGNKRIIPFQDRSEGYPETYQTMTSQEEYRAFSLEEHRLADYRQGKVGSPANANKQLSAMPFMSLSNRSPRNDRKKLDLYVIHRTLRNAADLDRLRGSAIEIYVGMSNSLNEDTQTSLSSMWSLPKNLISHYSPFFQAACSWDFQETRNERIELPEDDPALFALFVEWMYYGSYEFSSLSLHPSTDAKCWVLGDKLLCSEFKNYALSRLYGQHVATSFSRAVPYNDVQYAWDNTAPAAKLRQFYVDFVIQYFENPSRLSGTIGDWDALLQNHPDIRILLLQNFRHDPTKRTQIRDLREYLELDQSHLDPKLETRLTRLIARQKLEEARGSSFSSKAERGQIESSLGTTDALCAEAEVIPAIGIGKQEGTLEPLALEERKDISKKEKKKEKKKKQRKEKERKEEEKKAKLEIREEETASGSSAKAFNVEQESALNFESEPVQGPRRDGDTENFGGEPDEFTSSPQTEEDEEVVECGVVNTT